MWEEILLYNFVARDLMLYQLSSLNFESWTLGNLSMFRKSEVRFYHFVFRMLLFTFF